MEKTNRPNLFLVGSPKCGTTYLWSKLKEHPKIFSPKFETLVYDCQDNIFYLIYTYRDFYSYCFLIILYEDYRLFE